MFGLLMHFLVPKRMHAHDASTTGSNDDTGSIDCLPVALSRALFCASFVAELGLDSEEVNLTIPVPKTRRIDSGN